MKQTIIVLVIVIIAIGGFFLYKNITGDGAEQTPTPSSNESMTPEPSPTPTAELPEVIKATITTARGNIELELYPRIAPDTVANFVNLAATGFYDGTTFHRVVADFVIQGGDPQSKTLSVDDPKLGTGGPGYKFDDEINPKAQGLDDASITALESQGYKYNTTLQSLPVTVGVIAMANSGPNTNGSQFFIVTTKDQPYLNGKHTVFGKVVKGMDIVRKIKQGDKVNKITIVTE